ncbi:hypothetical protein GCM10023237_08580 [Streptomyces coeruleoprunus]
MDRRGTTRRTFMAGAAAVTGAGALGAAPPEAATGAAPGAAPAGQDRAASVAVLGGGVAGLTAAHELAERGFRVTVYERRALGGKARSMDVPGSARGGRRPLPAEHGFRFIPASTTTCRTRCAASPSPGTRTASSTTSSRPAR